MECKNHITPFNFAGGQGLYLIELMGKQTYIGNILMFSKIVLDIP
jgi:hypothetical protein